MTAQIPDRLQEGPNHWSLISCPPLEGMHPDIVPAAANDTLLTRSSACWRETIATWEIRDGTLWLVELRGKFALRDKRPIAAVWVQGVLRCTEGELVAYHHIGFASEFERELLIAVHAGRIGTRVRHTNKEGRSAANRIALRRLMPDGLLRFVDEPPHKPASITWLGLAGVYRNWNAELLAGLQRGAPLALVPQPNNRFDDNAIEVLANDERLGYVPREVAAELAPWMAEGVPVHCGFDAVISEGRARPASIHVTLLLPPEAPLPADEPDADPFEETSGSTLAAQKQAAARMRLWRRQPVASGQLARLEVENLRSVHRLLLDDLRQFNLLIGPHNTGKTTLLEAILLVQEMHVSPAVQTIHERRGLANAMRHADRLTDLYGRDGRDPMRVTSSGPRQRWEALSSPTDSYALVTLTCTHSDGKTEASQYYASVTRRERMGRTAALFVDAHGAQEAELARLLAQLTVQRKRGALLQALRELEPTLASLEAVLLPNAQSAEVWADVGEPELVPLRQLGRSFVRGLTLLVQLASQQDCIVLLDDVEEGFDARTRKGLWQAIGALAVAQRLQVFATTCSEASVLAAEAALAEQPHALRVLRLARSEAGPVVVG